MPKCESRLEIIEDLGVGKFGKRMVRCRCRCGGETIVARTRVEKLLTLSCGCLQKEHARRLGKAHSKPSGESACTCVYMAYRRSAKRRGLAFKITREQFKRMVLEPCAYCGCPPGNAYDRGNLNGAFVYNGLDRRNNVKGYAIPNLLPCCKPCNYAKGARTHAEFLAWVERVHAYQCQMRASFHQLGNM